MGQTLDIAGLRRAYAGGDARAGLRLSALLVMNGAVEEGARIADEVLAVSAREAWLFAAVLAAAGVGQMPNWRKALGALQAGFEAGDARALAQVETLLDAGLSDASALERWLDAPAPLGLALSADPRVQALPQFLPDAFCAHLIARAQPLRQASTIYDAERGGLITSDLRTASLARMTLFQSDLIVWMARWRIARALDIPLSGLETTNIIHYAPGEVHRPHFDYLDAREPYQAEEIARVGQRTDTVLIYLNTEYEGGETEFSRLNIRYKGVQAGDALAFVSVPKGAEAGDPRTLHAGLAPTSGEKWLLSQWVRNRPQPVL
ncbi:MAG: 2OG-Fe(II) oxygenase [Pseudomonadota bacterium]